jgi:hypothetical protein
MTDGISISLRVSLARAAVTPPPAVRLVRVLHELELPVAKRITPLGRPEVRPTFPNTFVPFGRSWQFLSKSMNPLLTPNNWTNAYDHKLWVANDNGFGDSNDPRNNYVTGEMGAQDPKVEVITCGGNLLSVIGEGSVKTNSGLEPCYIVETLGWDDPMPSLDYIMVRPWFQTWAVNMRSDGLPGRFSYGQQPNGYLPGFVHPLMGTGTAAIPKWRCEPWDSIDCDPYRLYKPV